MKTRALGLVLAGLTLLAMVPVALANPVTSTYEHHSVAAHNVLSSQAQVTSGGTLPFTGTNLAIMAAAGIALLGLGLGLRRVSRKRG